MEIVYICPLSKKTAKKNICVKRLTCDENGG